MTMGACAPRVAAYHFRGPGVGGVAAARLPVLSGHAVALHTKPRYRKGGPAPFLSQGTATFLLSAVSDQPLLAATTSEPQPRAPTVRPVKEREPALLLPTTDPSKLVVPPRVPQLALVGQRTEANAFGFALRNLRDMGARLRPELARAETGNDFAHVLAKRELLRTDIAPLLGDLVVFDQGWMIGLVTGARHDGTVEFIYAQGGRVRRGWVNPLYVRSKRDAKGRVLNTFIRPQNRSDRHDQRYLAGELFTGYVRLDDIVGADR